MRIIAFLASLMMFSATGFADEQCYQLSENGSIFSKTPELLCVNDLGGVPPAYEITLKTGFPTQTTLVTFNFDLLQRAKCLDCNADIYGVANPSNSIFNNLQIKFDGQREVFGDHSESGTVEIGSNRFFYRSL